MDMQTRVRLWDAINRYVQTCGGDPSKHVCGNTARMDAVVEVERVVSLAEVDVRRGTTANYGATGMSTLAEVAPDCE